MRRCQLYITFLMETKNKVAVCERKRRLVGIDFRMYVESRGVARGLALPGLTLWWKSEVKVTII